MPKFAILKGPFINDEDKKQAERKIMVSHVNKHILDLKEIVNQHRLAL